MALHKKASPQSSLERNLIYTIQNIAYIMITTPSFPCKKSSRIDFTKQYTSHRFLTHHRCVFLILNVPAVSGSYYITVNRSATEFVTETVSKAGRLQVLTYTSVFSSKASTHPSPHLIIQCIIQETEHKVR